HLETGERMLSISLFVLAGLVSFFFKATATPAIYTLSLHDALPIFLHRNFTRRQVAIQNRVASNIGISQSTFSVKVLNLFSRSRRKTNKRKSKHSAMLRNKEIQYLNAKGALTYTDIAGRSEERFSRN